MNKYAIISNEVPAICDALKEFGYKLIFTDCIDEFIPYEKSHADMQCCVIKDKVFVLNSAKSLLEELQKLRIKHNISSDIVSGKYPDNIKLNVLFLSDKLICKTDAIDSAIIKYCKRNNIDLINVKQGYASCSCAKISNTAIITADESIYAALKNTDIDVLKISPSGINLYGAKRGECGFIGGASVLLNECNVLFFGDITAHCDYNKIKEFCTSNNVRINYIPNIPLTDIGGCVLLNI